MNKEERLMMSEEEVRQRAKELLNLPKEHLITQYMFLEQENKKYKEVIDKIQKHCEIEINASNHYLKNHSSQKELCHKVAHQRILDILKEVE